MYEVSGKSATFQKQSVCASTADGSEAQGRRHALLPCSMQATELAWGCKKNRGTHVSVCFYNYYCSKQSFKRGNSFFNIKDFSSQIRSRRTQKVNNNNLHACNLLHSLNFPYCALLFMKSCFVKHGSWCSCQSDHYSTRPEKQS